MHLQIDTRFNLKPGNKFYEWERRGVPIRIECGPRDVEAGTLLCARRTGGDKFPLPLDDQFASVVRTELDGMQSALFEAAQARVKASTFEPESYADMAAALEASDGQSAPGFYLVPW